MNKNLNRRKYSLLRKKNIFYFTLIILILFFIILFYSKKNLLINYFSSNIDKFSYNFEYQFLNLKASGLEKVELKYLDKKLHKYYKTSIFLLPLKKISNEIKENNWIKNVKLSTNYKDTLFIDIDEYIPIGLYKFNKKIFYFDQSGKIIEEFFNDFDDKNNLIIFLGPSSNLNAKSILDILEYLNFQNKFGIKSINYIEKRRWDLILNNNIRLMLSENDPKKSLKNFINIEKNLSEIDLNNIKYFDLRNKEKTLIYYN